ncbi:hypothetical protein TrLO_g1468 [Triparma laevis f. longispina]|uniref:Uncharacterized protein n=1 Tax=Triparma laevis f. longispina TaxID=1714387 RepID=A0A9W7EJ33_9STRA|nr:hypothetical protein TrLO_g1468 [Triparma laevis f. longispina]
MATEVDLEAQKNEVAEQPRACASTTGNTSKTTKIKHFRYGLTFNAVLTLSSNLLYYIYDWNEWTDDTLYISFTPIIIVLFLAICMYCLNKPGGDGHVTIGGRLVTKCMTYILSAVGLGAAFAIAYLWNSKDSHDEALVAISSTVPWVSVFMLTCLALYSPLDGTLLSVRGFAILSALCHRIGM